MTGWVLSWQKRAAHIPKGCIFEHEIYENAEDNWLNQIKLLCLCTYKNFFTSLQDDTF